MLSSPRLVFLVALFLVAAAPHAAFALSTYCVNSTAGLDSALAQAQDDDVRINLVQGSYDMRATRLIDLPSQFDIEATLTIVGGYAPGCGSRSYDAALTSLYADTSTDIWLGSGADITLAVLTMRDFGFARLEPFDGGAIVSDNHDLKLDHVVFRNGGEVAAYASNTYLKQVAVTNSHGGCGFTVRPSALDLVQVENSLFANNAADGFCIRNPNAAPTGWGDAAIYNSIFWNNGGDDIDTISDEGQSDIVLRYNLYQGTHIVPAPATAPLGTLTSDPLFVDAAGGDFRIGNASPARNSASSAIPDGVPTTDLQGLQRLVGSAIDRGPYENQSAGTQLIYTVRNTNDSGADSLRQALLDAEANPGLNGILFDIPGATCPNVITVPDKDNPLPVITQPLYIDGLSQPGSSGNPSDDTFDATLCILLKAGTDVAQGLVVDDSAPTSAAVTIKGLGFTGFTTAAIDLRGGGNHYVGGNQFAGSMGGNTLNAGSYAIRVSRQDPPALDGTQIGGDDPNQRNLIGSAGYGLLLVGDQVRDTLVLNNFIGVAANGIGANANSYGIVDLGAIDSTIRDNWIGGNGVDGIFLNGSDAYVTGNHIGVAPVAGPLGNGGWGVRLNLSGGGNANNVVGSGVAYYFGIPTPLGDGNVIANNTLGGIRADGGLGHRFSRNIVYGNGEPEIDIAADGFTFNDNDAAAGASSLSNRGQNYPVIAGLQGGDHTQGTIHATLSSRNGTYRVEVYTASACYHTGLSGGAARVYHGATIVTIGNAPAGQNGSVDFDYLLKAKVGANPLDDRGIVMLAIDADGNTSELSLCNTYHYSDVIFADGFQ